MSLLTRVSLIAAAVWLTPHGEAASPSQDTARRVHVPPRAVTAASLSGRVFDHDHKAVANAKVIAHGLQAIDGSDEGHATARSVRSGADGEYRFDAIPPGTYYVSALLSESLARRPAGREEYGATYYPSTPFLSQAQAVVLADGDDVMSVDVVMRKAVLASVSGALLSTSGRVADGTHVTIGPGPSVGPAGLYTFSATATPDSMGCFIIAKVPPGEYLLRARSIPAHVVREIVTTGSNAALGRANDIEYAAMELRVEGSDVEDLVLALQRCGRLSGRVVRDSMRSAGPLFVSARPLSGDSLVCGIATAPVAPDGAFTLNGLVGDFLLRTVDGHGTSVTEGVELERRDVTGGVTVLAGSILEGVAVRIRAPRSP